ncbi:hypothetical protein HJFPF1_10711 [Paramyrothecium foliicola]|nr:hypothetical protein HJFPF1_10711 [Paramyrothecium foliicola]
MPGDIVKFFEWTLNHKVGKGGHKKKGIKKARSLQTRWKVFRLVCERAMEAKLDPRLSRMMPDVSSRMLDPKMAGNLWNVCSPIYSTIDLTMAGQEAWVKRSEESHQ